MPVKLEIAIREGWKASDNSRFGEVMEIRFKDAETNKIMFRYAPKCEDKAFWLNTFKILGRYDNQLKKLRVIVDQIAKGGEP